MKSNIQEAEKIVKASGYTASFSGYSEAHGISVYFKTQSGQKIRVSTHSVTNTDRLLNEVHLSFPVATLSATKKEVKQFVLTKEMIEAAKARKSKVIS